MPVEGLTIRPRVRGTDRGTSVEQNTAEQDGKLNNSAQLSD
jgi:hypothetical protein